MVATTWVVPSAVFFTSIIGWQYFVGHRSVPVGKCYVQYMDSAVFNCLLQVGYFWATLVVMCALYTGIYRVALRLHRESAARRRNIAAVTAQTTQHVGPTSSAVSTSAVYKLVTTATVSAARDHHRRADHAHRTRASVTGGFSDSSLSDHDVAPRRHNHTNEVKLLLPVMKSVKSLSRQADDDVAIELQEMTQLGTNITAMTFNVDDDDIRFADDVTEDDDDATLRDRQVTSTSDNDVNVNLLRCHQHCHHQQQESDQVLTRDYLTPGSVRSSERDTCRHSAECRELARIDTATGTPARRRFCGHRRLSSRRRQRRSKSTTCKWNSSSSEVIDELSASLRHFTRHRRRFLLSFYVLSRAPRPSAKVTAAKIISDHPPIKIKRTSWHDVSIRH